MTRVLIIEDEELAAEKLKMILGKIEPLFEVVDVIQSYQKAVRWLEQNEADLIFLDIHLSDGNSFKIFESVQVQTPIIFTTAYDQYAINAFKQNSIDYLLKPIEEKELIYSLEQFKKLNSSQKISFPESLTNLIDSFNPKAQKRFMVYSGDRIKSIDVESISHFYAESKTVFLQTFDKRTYSIDVTLDKLESRLSSDDFFRVNRKFIVNMKGIDEIFQYSKGKLKLHLNPPNQFEVLVPLERISSFKKWLNK